MRGKKRPKKKSLRRASGSGKCRGCGFVECRCNAGICYAKLHPIHLGLTLGITWGVALLGMASLNLQGQYATTFTGLVFGDYLGAISSAQGAFLSLIYGFMDGFFGGIIIASLYNYLNRHWPA